MGTDNEALRKEKAAQRVQAVRAAADLVAARARLRSSISSMYDLIGEWRCVYRYMIEEIAAQTKKEGEE